VGGLEAQRQIVVLHGPPVCLSLWTFNARGVKSLPLMKRLLREEIKENESP
jgi:hypothetical protein